MTYQTRSNTLQLQRLIGVLKERGDSEAANSLETSSADLFNDVKVRQLTIHIPKYDPTIYYDVWDFTIF